MPSDQLRADLLRRSRRPAAGQELPAAGRHARSRLETVTSGAIKLNDVIARFSSRDRQTFIFLDACRNNPLGDTRQHASNGLAQVEVGENTFIAFATQPGNVTVDGIGTNSPFTTSLMKNVEIPGLSISDMMIRVRNETGAADPRPPGALGPVEPARAVLFHRAAGARSGPAERQPGAHPVRPGDQEKLQIELTSNDLRTAMIIVGQTLRSRRLDAEPSAPAKPAGTQDGQPACRKSRRRPAERSLRNRDVDRSARRPASRRPRRGRSGAQHPDRASGGSGATG